MISAKHPLSIFVSSNWREKGLDEERAIIKSVIEELHYQFITGDRGSDDAVPMHCSKEVDRCDILILLLGKDHGDNVEIEYQTAIGKIPILVFMKHPVEREDKLNNFIKIIESRKTRIKFEKIIDLEDKVRANLIDLISERFRNYKKYNEGILSFLEGKIVTIPKRLLITLIKLNQITPEDLEASPY